MYHTGKVHGDTAWPLAIDSPRNGEEYSCVGLTKNDSNVSPSFMVQWKYEIKRCQG